VSSVVQLALVMVMGAGLGLTLGIPQWQVLKRHAWQAGWWVLANVVAWALGLPVLLEPVMNFGREMVDSGHETRSLSE
jgi:hypothetical protein